MGWLMRGLGAALLLLTHAPGQAAYVRRATVHEVRVERLARAVAPGGFLEVHGAAAVVGMLRVEEADGRAARCRVVCGEAPVGATVEPLSHSPVRVALLTDTRDGPAARELRTLFPGGVTILGPEGRGLEPSRFDAAVSVLHRPQSLPALRFALLEAFARAGRPVFVGLDEYAARRGVPVDVVRGAEPPPPVRCASAHGTMAGLAVGDTLSWHGRDGNFFVRRQLRGTPEDARALLASTGPEGGVVAVVESVGDLGGFIAALDFVSPNGRPGRDAGSRWKWIPLGNAVSRSVRFARGIPRRLPFEDLMARIEDTARRYPGRVTAVRIGADAAGRPIMALRVGEAGRPAFLIQAGIHGEEWANCYAALRLAEVLATPQSDTRASWVMGRYSVWIVPVANPSGYALGRQPNAGDCDVDLNFDYNWEALTFKPLTEWRGHIPISRLKGTRPWSEPEARALRDLLTHEPIIGYVSLQRHSEDEGWRLYLPHPNASLDLQVLGDVADLATLHLQDRFLWGRGRQVTLPSTPWLDEPVSYHWASARRIPSCSLESVGEAEGCVVATEVVHEACLTFMQVVGLRFAAQPWAWAVPGRREIERPAGRPDLIAILFEKEGRRHVAYWRHRGAGTLRVVLRLDEPRLWDAEGGHVEFERTSAELRLPVGDPMVLDCGSAPEEGLVRAFQSATFAPGPRQVLWVPAREGRLFGRIRRASHLGLKEPGALADALVCAARSEANLATAGWAEFNVKVPVTDAYTVWAHFRCPAGATGSFALVAPGERLSADPDLVVGRGVAGAPGWRWASLDATAGARPGARRRVVHLRRGWATLRLYPREGPGTLEGNPRLDFLCLSSDPEYIPSDRDVPAALRHR